MWHVCVKIILFMKKKNTSHVRLNTPSYLFEETHSMLRNNLKITITDLSSLYIMFCQQQPCEQIFFKFQPGQGYLYRLFIPLTNWGQELWCRLHTTFFSTSTMNWSGKKQGAITNSMDPENKVSKMFIISLENWIALELLNQPMIAHLVPEKYNKVFERKKGNVPHRNLVCAEKTKHIDPTSSIYLFSGSKFKFLKKGSF